MGVIGNGDGGLLCLLPDLILLLWCLWLLLLLSLHLCVRLWLSAFSLCSSFSWLGCLCWLRRSRNILLDGDLLLFGPLLLEVAGLEDGDLVDVVANPEDEGNLIVVLLLTLLDGVGGYLAGETSEELGSL